MTVEGQTIRTAPCTGEGLLEVEVIRDVRIPLGSNGESLSGDLFLPRTPNSVPGLVTVLPYRKDAGAGIQSETTLRWFARRGIASVLVDFRGTGLSDGAQRPPFDSEEADDAIAAIAWVAQQEWCNGNVGMWGISYGASITMRAATRRPQNLRAIMPIMGMMDPERDFIHPGGVRGCLSAAFWATYTLCDQLLPPLERCIAGDEMRRWSLRLERTEPWLLDLWRHGPGDDEWRARVLNPDEITIPSFVISGWRDMFCDSQIRAFEQMKGPKKLLVGPWMHTLPNVSPFEPMEYRWEALRWWNYWLKGEKNDLMNEPAITLYVQRSGSPWRRTRTWPPEHAMARFFASKRDGVLEVASATASCEASDSEGIGALSSTQAAGALSGLTFYPSNGFGLPVDQHDDDMTAVCVTTDALPSPRTILGRPLVRVSWREVCGPSRVTAKLMHVTPDGRSLLITSGTASRLPSGKHADLILGATSYHLPVGHKLRVTVSDSDFPRMWPTDAGGGSVVRIATIGLEVPLVECDFGEGVEAVTPAAEDGGDQLTLAYFPRWTITRDLVAGGVQVDVGQSLSALSPNRKYALQRDDHVLATSVPKASIPTIVSSTSQVKVQGGAGQRIEVTAEIVMTGNTLRAVGKVVVDGETIFTKRWDTGPTAGPQVSIASRLV